MTKPNLTTHTLAGKKIDTGKAIANASKPLRKAPEGAKCSKHADEMRREKMKPWLDQHIWPQPLTGLVKALPADSDYQHLFHTNITIREMRAAVADAGFEVKRHESEIRTQWRWIDSDGYGHYYADEHTALQRCIDINNLDPAQYAREPKQWLAVSDQLAPLLREQGETVREFAGLCIWLKCTEDSYSSDPVLRAIWEAKE